MRRIVGSTLKYSPRPPITPAIILSSLLLYSFLLYIFIILFYHISEIDQKIRQPRCAICEPGLNETILLLCFGRGHADIPKQPQWFPYEENPLAQIDVVPLPSQNCGILFLMMIEMIRLT